MIIKTDKSFRESLKNWKLQDIVYPVILVVFFGIVFILFFFATQFISKNINNIFRSEETGTAQALNLEHYKLTAKKLGIVVNIPKEGGTGVIKMAPSVETATTTLNKKAITIIVKNGTAKSGVAGTLAISLETAGFAKAKTGNEKTLFATTTVAIKESKSALGQSLLEEVRKTYPDAVSTSSPETALFDAIITIGTR